MQYRSAQLDPSQGSKKPGQIMVVRQTLRFFEIASERVVPTCE